MTEYRFCCVAPTAISYSELWECSGSGLCRAGREGHVSMRTCCIDAVVRVLRESGLGEVNNMIIRAELPANGGDIEAIKDALSYFS